MLDMVTAGLYSSYLLDNKSLSDRESCFILKLDAPDSERVMIEGDVVTGREIDKIKIVEYVSSYCTRRVKSKIDDIGILDGKLPILAYYDFLAWRGYNYNIGMYGKPAAEWSPLKINLIMDCMRPRDMRLTLVTESKVSRLSIDLRESEVSGDLLTKDVVSYLLENAGVSYAEALDNAHSVVGAEHKILKYAKSAWDLECSRNAHLN